MDRSKWKKLKVQYNTHKDKESVNDRCPFFIIGVVVIFDPHGKDLSGKKARTYSVRQCNQ